jgi:hypothetical protein
MNDEHHRHQHHVAVYITCISTPEVQLWDVHMSNLPQRKGVHSKWPVTSCFCRSSCGHAPTSIDDEPGAVVAGGYGIDPQGEAALLAEV